MGWHIVHIRKGNNMAKPPTQTTSMDAVLNDLGPKVRIQRHHVDRQSPADDVHSRIVKSLDAKPTGCLYFNPAVTVSSAGPSPDFFRIVRKEQARWCRQSRSDFYKNARRSSKNWVTDEGWINDKFVRFMDRALCFTGILFIGGRLIQPHNWPKPPALADRRCHPSSTPDEVNA